MFSIHTASTSTDLPRKQVQNGQGKPSKPISETNGPSSFSIDSRVDPVDPLREIFEEIGGSRGKVRKKRIKRKLPKDDSTQNGSEAETVGETLIEKARRKRLSSHGAYGYYRNFPSPAQRPYYRPGLATATDFSLFTFSWYGKTMHGRKSKTPYIISRYPPCFDTVRFRFTRSNTNATVSHKKHRMK